MELTIKIDTSKKDGLRLLQYIKSLSFVKVIEEKDVSTLLENAISDVEENKTIKMTGEDELSMALKKRKHE